MRRETLLQIINDTKQPEPVRARARRQLEQMDEAAEPKPKAEEAKAPDPGQASPLSMQRFREIKIDVSDLLKKPGQVEPPPMRHFHDTSASKATEIAVAAELKPVPEQKQQFSEQAKAVLRKAGRELIAQFEGQEVRCFKSLEMNLGNDRAVVRPNREEERQLKAAALRLVQWFRTSGDVPNEPEFAAGKKKLAAYLLHERDEQLLAEKANRLIDFVTTPHDPPKKPQTDGFFDPDRVFHPQSK